MILTFDLWPCQSIGFQILLRTKYVPGLVKIHWRDVDSRVFTRMVCGKKLTQWPWPLTLKINRVPDSRKDKICTKFGQNPLKDVDPRVFTRMLRKDGRTKGRTEGLKEGRMDGSVTISLRNFVGEGIINYCSCLHMKSCRVGSVCFSSGLNTANVYIPNQYRVFVTVSRVPLIQLSRTS